MACTPGPPPTGRRGVQEMARRRHVVIGTGCDASGPEEATVEDDRQKAMEGVMHHSRSHSGMPMPRRKRNRWLWSAAAVVLAAGCAGAANRAMPSPAGDSGIASPAATSLSGRVLLRGGPLRADGEMALNGTPAEGMTVAVMQGSHRIASVVTGPDGKFTFDLSPGWYALVSSCSTITAHPETQETVQVEAGARAVQNLTCHVP